MASGMVGSVDAAGIPVVRLPVVELPVTGLPATGLPADGVLTALGETPCPVKGVVG